MLSERASAATANRWQSLDDTSATVHHTLTQLGANAEQLALCLNAINDHDLLAFAAGSIVGAKAARTHGREAA